ncbi:putative aarF domain-containing protein kinase 5, partial [Larus michahellis]|uniref:putative aarF domain-containing protein kinase 5 n=1 Tax=Larus michahellis TaxID=119627 RepID=UPI003D9B02D6
PDAAPFGGGGGSWGLRPQTLTPPPAFPPPDYFLFCEILLQRPLGGAGRAGAGPLSAAERGYLQAMAAQRFPRVLRVLRALPRPMLLVFRNLNTVRSLHAALGAPVDRYVLMARSAVRSWSRLSAGRGRGGAGRWVRGLWEGLKFELALRLGSLSTRLAASLLRLLGSCGLVPQGRQLARLLRA